MSTPGPEHTQTLTAQLFGPSSKHRALAVGAWVFAVAAQALAVTLIVRPTGERPIRVLPEEQADRVHTVASRAAPVCRGAIDERTRESADEVAAADARWAEQAEDLVEYAGSRFARMSELLGDRAACGLTRSWAR
jgi:hypothetical protein